MDQLVQFISDQWLLVTAFVMVLVAVIAYEIRQGAGGGKRLDASAATQLYNRDQAQFVDLRGDQEFRAGHLPGALHLPANATDERLKRVKKARAVIVYDENGLQLNKGLQRLKSAGIENVYGLRGGIAAWRTAGYPIEKK
ncbi:rhodanese-like domain-containing protein [Alkalilimnicola sp. S0819]|uniref:rhodanese-like domain-containing protein n=1 Tax=Alkalilimnicola sp. S0819 TaxID=2613922 RepID=UPI00186A84B2|nr:rhodanese-like domain-containing protein [Alkalilimnicola sp. S0819]